MVKEWDLAKLCINLEITTWDSGAMITEKATEKCIGSKKTLNQESSLKQSSSLASGKLVSRKVLGDISGWKKIPRET